MKKFWKTQAKKSNSCSWCIYVWQPGEDVVIFDDPFEMVCMDCIKIYQEERKSGLGLEERIAAIEKKLEALLKQDERPRFGNQMRGSIETE